MIAAEGLSIELACRALAVSASGFYARRSRPPSARALRHVYLTEIIRQVHLDSRGTYGARRVHADLVLGHGLVVGHCAVEMLMARAGIAGLSGRPQYRRMPRLVTAGDLVERQFGREKESRNRPIAPVLLREDRPAVLELGQRLQPCVCLLDGADVTPVITWEIDDGHLILVMARQADRAIENAPDPVGRTTKVLGVVFAQLEDETPRPDLGNERTPVRSFEKGVEEGIGDH